MAAPTFEREYEINASRAILFPYIHTAAGLAQWFADDVNLDFKKNFLFYWDGEVQPATLASARRDQYVRFEYLNDNGQASDDQPFVEFYLEKNEFTDTTFLRVVDGTGEMDDEEELEDIWDGMVDALKELVGG